MSLPIAILLGIICIQLFINSYLLNELEKKNKEEDRYYRRLRMDYDKRIRNLKDEIRYRDELLKGKVYGE